MTVSNVFELRPSAGQDRAAAAESFAEFWSHWPKRVAKDAAERAWRKLSPAEQRKAIDTLGEHIKKWAERGGPEVIPHAAMWLNGKCFDGELDIIFCHWAGCPRSGRFTRGTGIYCRIHYDALLRGEVPSR